MSKESGSVEGLNDMQLYVAREMIDEYRAGALSRRSMLARVSVVCGSAAGAALLAACGDKEGARILMGADGGVDAAAVVDARASGDGPPPAGVLSVRADDPDIDATRVEFASTAPSPIIGYLARPKAAGSYPGVIVIHENRGLNDHIRDVARRLAKAKFIALAPDLTSRAGSTERIDTAAAMAALTASMPADLVADLVAGVEFLSKTTGVAPTEKLGVVGFCFGGGYTYRLAAASPKIAAAAPYYGPTPVAVIDMVKTSNAAFLIHHAEMDDGVNTPTPQLLEALMGKTVMLESHPGTKHAFNNDTGANYNEAEAVKAWNQTLTWFKTYLK